MSSVSHCVWILLQTSTGSSVLILVAVWAVPGQSIFPGEAYPKELGMSEVPGRCCLTARSCAPCPAPLLTHG